MALDGLVIHQIQKELQAIVPAKINKIQQVSDCEILFTIRSNNKNHKLMISCHSSFSRIHLTSREYKAPEVAYPFVMVLRKHINGAIIKNIKQVGLDRILVFTLESRNELGDIHDIYMYVELMGKYANIILVNDENKIIDALKKIPPYENNIRTIHPGATFVEVSPQTEKQNPFEATNISIDVSFSKVFYGISPLLSSEIHYRLAQGETFSSIMNEIQESDSIYIYEKDNKLLYHLLPLKHLEMTAKKLPIQKAFDEMYYEKEEKVRIKEQSGDLFKLVKQELKKSRNKLVKLNRTLESAYDLEDYRTYGDLLYAYAYKFPYKQKEVTLPSFETGEDIIIPLDEKYDIKTNAKKYYQKYNKAKTAQIEVAKQIELAKTSISYFENLEVQLDQANLMDAAEIREELNTLGYLRKKQRFTPKKKKKTKPNFITLEIEGVQIYIGKNNTQNDYITWKQSRKDYLWFHAKDIHGSHVVINQSEVSEEIIRIAAMFAAYYSKARLSSSVPVNYCFIRQLRKPNNAALGFVTLTNYKTIYIDPIMEEIEKYLTLYKKG